MAAPHQWELVNTERDQASSQVTTTMRMRVPTGWLYVFTRVRNKGWYGLRFGYHETDSMVFVPEAAAPPHL